MTRGAQRYACVRARTSFRAQGASQCEKQGRRPSAVLRASAIQVRFRRQALSRPTEAQMKRRSTRALLTLLLLFCAQHAAAQQPAAQSSGAAEAERRAELEKSAVALLREAVSDSQGLKLFENRVRPQTAAAALLWTRDEPEARALFKSSAEALVAYCASLDPEDPQFYNAAQLAVQLRGELIQAIAQYDPKLALEY